MSCRNTKQGFENAVVGADKAIIVVNPEVTSVRDADRVIGKLDPKGLDPQKDQKLLINRLNPEMTQKGDMLDIPDIIEILSVDILGVVPDDKKVTISTNKGEPIVLDKESRAGKFFLNVAQRIIDDGVPLIKPEAASEGGFFAKLSRLFKK